MKVRGNLLRGEARFVDALIKKTKMETTKLSEYIEGHHSGNSSAYARELGVSPVQVKRWLDLGCMVIDGEVWRKVSKQVKKES